MESGVSSYWCLRPLPMMANQDRCVFCFCMPKSQFLTVLINVSGRICCEQRCREIHDIAPRSRSGSLWHTLCDHRAIPLRISHDGHDERQGAEIARARHGVSKACRKGRRVCRIGEARHREHHAEWGSHKVGRRHAYAESSVAWFLHGTQASPLPLANLELDSVLVDSSNCVIHLGPLVLQDHERR